MNDIISWLKDIEDYFYDAYLEVWDWVYPFWLLGYPLLYISRGFGWLAYYFGEFRLWLYWAQDEIEDILSWSNIRSLIRGWLDGIEYLVDWFSDWWDNVTDVVGDWWEAVQVTVKGWIKVAVQGLDDLIEAWDTFWNITWTAFLAQFDTLRDSWDNFWTVTFPTLVSFAWLQTWWNSRLAEVNDLIDSKLAAVLPFYDDLVSLWDSIKEFFADPLQWAYDQLDEWFERFW